MAEPWKEGEGGLRVHPRATMVLTAWKAVSLPEGGRKGERERGREGGREGGKEGGRGGGGREGGKEEGGRE